MPKLHAHKLFTYTGHKAALYGLGKGFAPNTFVTGGAEGWVVEWDFEQPSDGQLLVKANSPVYSFLVLNEEKRLLCGTSAGHLHVLDMQQRQETRNIEAHRAGIFDLALNGNKIISAGGEGCLKVWDRETLTLLANIQHSDKKARVIAFHPTLPQMAVGYSDATIRVFDSNSFELLQEINGHSNTVMALAYSPNGEFLLSGGLDAVLKIWKVYKGFAPVQTINAHWLHINAIQYSPAGQYFATASMDKTLKIWDANTFELLKVLDKEKYDGHTSSVNKILWVDDNRLISCSDDKTAKLWQIGT